MKTESFPSKRLPETKSKCLISGCGPKFSKSLLPA